MRKENCVVKEWNSAAESWVDFVRKGKDHFRDELNTPGMLKVIGNMKDLQVLDIACGEGHNTRILASRGAKVTGIDLSEGFIKHAKEQEKIDQLGSATTFRTPPTYQDLPLDVLIWSRVSWPSWILRNKMKRYVR